MGFSSGAPFSLGYFTLSYWLSTEDVSLTKIGGVILTSLPYSLKFLWSPFVDQLKIPFMNSFFGHRRAWLLISQACLFFSLIALGASQPKENFYYLVNMAFLVAFFSATQDIVVDAYRIEALEDKEQGAGVAMTQFGYRLGLLVAGAGAIFLSSWKSWFEIYSLMACLIGIGVLGVLIAPTTKTPSSSPYSPSTLLSPSSPSSSSSIHVRVATFFVGLIHPFSELLKRKASLFILLFVLLYKYGDAVAGAMTNPFYHQMGFTPKEIAGIGKSLGTLATLIGVFLGGFLVAKFNIFINLLVGGVFQAMTNLIFSYLAIIEAKTNGWLALAVFTDNFVGGIGTSVFVAYLSLLCHKKFTATQYALLSSIASLGRIFLTSGSGWLAQTIGWPLFFVLTTFLAVPGLVLIFILRSFSVHGESKEKNKN